MTRLAVDGLTFTFPAGWAAEQYDQWSFYRNQFGKLRDGITAIDVLALSPSGTVWFVEVKDYRLHDVAQKLKRLLKAIDAHPVVAEKCRMGALDWRVE